jgi:hypothetical protein
MKYIERFAKVVGRKSGWVGITGEAGTDFVRWLVSATEL